jgi:hypothetical protein
MAIGFEFEITGLPILHNLKAAFGYPRRFAHFDLTPLLLHARRSEGSELDPLSASIFKGN